MRTRWAERSQGDADGARAVAGRWSGGLDAALPVSLRRPVDAVLV